MWVWWGWGASVGAAVSYGTNQHIGWAFIHSAMWVLYLPYRALGFGA